MPLSQPLKADLAVRVDVNLDGNDLNAIPRGNDAPLDFLESGGDLENSRDDFAIGNRLRSANDFVEFGVIFAPSIIGRDA